MVEAIQWRVSGRAGTRCGSGGTEDAARVVPRRAWLALLLAGGGTAIAGRWGAQAAENGPDTAVERARRSLLLSVARVGPRLVAVGAYGNVLFSDDDAATWRLAPSGTGAVLTAVAFGASGAGWAVGYDVTILRTADGGATWSVQREETKDDKALFSVAGITADGAAGAAALAVGAYGLALERGEGGWNPVRVESGGDQDDYHLNAAARLADGTLLIVGEAGQAYRRLPGEEGWATLPLPYQGSQFGCLPMRDGGALSFGLRGSLFRLADGDTPKWSRIETGTQAGFMGGAVLQDGRVALVGADGTVLVGDPGGHGLKPAPFPDRQTLSGVAEARDGRLVVVGERGVSVLEAP